MRSTIKSCWCAGPTVLMLLAGACSFDSSGAGSTAASGMSTGDGTDGGSTGGGTTGTASNSASSTTGGSASGSATSTSSTSGATASSSTSSTSVTTTTSSTSSTSGGSGGSNTTTTGDPPSPYYGDCNDEFDCEPTEFCVEIGGLGFACAAGCFSTADCPDAPAGTNAAPECVPLSQGVGNACILACDGGTACPASMQCAMLMVGDVCYWP